MFTPQSLLEMSVNDTNKYETLLKEFPPGTVNTERNDAHMRASKALLCAEWMEKEGITEIANIGPFLSTHIIKGQRIKLRKGSLVFGTFKGGQEGITLTRAQTITVHDVYSGYVDQERGGKVALRQPAVVWAGSGGYWRRTDLNNVELV